MISESPWGFVTRARLRPAPTWVRDTTDVGHQAEGIQREALLTNWEFVPGLLGDSTQVVSHQLEDRLKLVRLKTNSKTPAGMPALRAASNPLDPPYVFSTVLQQHHY
jgi:hypothetical protein